MHNRVQTNPKRQEIPFELTMSVQPRTMVNQIAAEADEEENGELSFRTASDVRSRRDKAQRFRQSPKTYLGIMASLQAYDMVLEEVFTSDCPLIMQLRLVRLWLQHGRNYFEPCYYIGLIQ
jgi:hypothetical protein